MIDAISELIRYIVILLFLTVLLEMILPQGIFRRYLRVITGILLIFTLLTPLQKIMHIAPLWDEDTFFTDAQVDSEDLEQILAGGEALQEENIRLALQDYRSNIFTMIENELMEKYQLELLQLELSLEEDSSSKEFGLLQELSLIVQDKKENKVENGGSIKVEKVRIAVNSASEQEMLLTVQPPKSQNTEVLAQEDLIKKHLALFLQLAPEKVKITLLQ